MQQQLRPLDVTQKAIAQASTRVRSFDQTRNVGNDKRTKVSEVNHAEVRFQRGERVVGNLGTRRGNSGNKRRLSGIRKTHQPNIREQLQFELQLALFALAAALVISRRTIGRTREVRVAETTTAAARSLPAIALAVQVM